MLSLVGSRLVELIRGLPSPRGLLPLVLGLMAWEIASPEKSPYFPPPSTWWAAITALFSDGSLLPALGATLVTFSGAIVIATTVGMALGVMVGSSARIASALGPLLEFFRSLPPPVIIPLAILFFGYEESLKLFAVVWAAAWPILLNVASSVLLINSLLLDAGRMLHLGRLATLRKVIVPSSLPALLIGVRIALPLAIVVTLVTEMLTLMPGLGSLIVIAQREFHSATVYGLLVLIGAIGFILNNGYTIVEGLLLSRWPSAEKTGSSE